MVPKGTAHIIPFGYMTKSGQMGPSASIRSNLTLESPVVEHYLTQYPEDGSYMADKPLYKDGHVYINEVQYFAIVPLLA